MTLVVRIRAIAAIALLLGTPASILTSNGQAASEQADAGNSVATAQQMPGVGITTLSGTLNVDTDIDLFLITIDDHANFSATTTPGPGTVYDSRLYLFTSTGEAVYMNDDDPGNPSGYLSMLPAGDPLGPQSDGDYILGISTYFAVPLDASNTQLFTEPDDDSVPDYTQTNGPVSPNPLTHWNLANIQTAGGTYTITLTGVDGGLAIRNETVSAIASESSVHVRWTTTAGTQARGYEVLMTEQGYSGRHTEGFVPARPGQSSFDFDARSVEPGNYVVTIVEVRLDGTRTDQATTNVTVLPASGRYVSAVYPNPASGQARIDAMTSTNEEVQLTIFDLTGRVVVGTTHEQLTGATKTTLRVDVDALATGSYVLVLSGKGFRESRLLGVVR